MALPKNERVVQLRQLEQRLDASPPSPQRDELLHQARLRMVEIEAPPDFDPPSSLPALSGEDIERRIARFFR